MPDSKQNHPLSEEAFINKARLYVSQMDEQPADSWQRGLWAALSLELLARATLAHISPILLVRAHKWENLLFALGKRDIAVAPMAITTGEVIQRLNALVPKLRGDSLKAIQQIIDLRNSELHSGNPAFISEYGSQSLQSKFYFACAKLLESMGRQVSDVFPNPRAIEQAVNSFQDAAAQSVLRDIDAFRVKWSQKPKEQQERLVTKAKEWASPEDGHVVCCPSCNSHSLLQGDAITPSRIEVVKDANNIIVRNTVLPTSFECIACGLKIAGYSRLSACKLGSEFTRKTVHSASDYFGLFNEEKAWDYFLEFEAASAHETDYNE